MRVIAVSGSASGIGAAVREQLQAAGDRVIGVDLHDADVNADLSNPAGRASAVAGVTAVADGRIDGLVLCAGVMRPDALCISVNHFGAVALLEGLRPLLAAAPAPAAVVVASYAASSDLARPEAVDACLAGDEERARSLAAAERNTGYATSKLAVARWVRHHAPQPDWAGAGITLNAIAPGVIRTPMVQWMLDRPDMNAVLEQSVPMPIGRRGEASEVAAVVTFLLSASARLVVGQVLFVDGGAHALLYPDRAP